SFLKKASDEHPLVLILDDLHWADPYSLLLLQFMARELRHSAVMIVGTYRDIPLENDHPLSSCLAELSRQRIVDRIVLAGLSKHDAGRFIELTTGAEPSDELVAAVHQQTEGNPFFLSEVLKLLVADGRFGLADTTASLDIRIPQSVREVLGNRLDRLSE